MPDGSAATPARSIIRPQCQSIRCETVLVWLRAAKSIKHGHHIGKARKAFQDLEEELQPELVHTERGNPYSYSSLRRQRANLDIVCMNLFRLFWMTLDWSTVHIMVHLDASPHWRGNELLAGSFDLIIRNVAYFCQHRYFPQLRIGPALFTVKGKCFALLWMIWLMVGPSFRAVRAFCDRVTFIVSDYGSEHKIPDLPDLLPDFSKNSALTFLHQSLISVKSSYFHKDYSCQDGITYSMVWYGGGCSPWIVLVKSY